MNELLEIFTFENFLAGPSNQEALATAKRVAKMPSAVTNPMIILSPYSGNGATHLGVAIAGQIENRFASGVSIFTVEQFSVEMKRRSVESIAKGLVHCRCVVVDSFDAVERMCSHEIEGLTQLIAKLVERSCQVIITGNSRSACEFTLKDIMHGASIVEVGPLCGVVRDAILDVHQRLSTEADSWRNLIHRRNCRAVREVIGLLRRAEVFGR